MYGSYATGGLYYGEGLPGPARKGRSLRTIEGSKPSPGAHIHVHTHTHIYIYIYPPPCRWHASGVRCFTTGLLLPDPLQESPKRKVTESDFSYRSRKSRNPENAPLPHDILTFSENVNIYLPGSSRMSNYPPSPETPENH